MAHFKPEELIDFAEGGRPETSEPHLVECEVCRRHIADLRVTLSLAASDAIPEPSPLFWDHLSARVHDAVEADGANHPTSWMDRWLGWKVMAPAAAVLVAVLAVAVGVRMPSSVRQPSSSVTTVDGAAVAVPDSTSPIDGSLESAATAGDDSNWVLMGDLVSGLDWDAAAEAGLTTSVGSVDQAVYDLTPDERRELQRLLQQELAQVAKGSAS